MYGLIGPESLTDAESGALNTGSIRVTDATTTALTGILTAGHLTPVDATAGNATYTLPAASSVPAGAVTAVKKADAGTNTVTVQRAGSDVVYGTTGGGTTRAVTLPGESAVLTSNGVNAWTVMASDTPVSQLDARYNGTYAGLSVQVPRIPAAALPFQAASEVSANAVHPDIVYVPNGWGSDGNGKAWKYWAVFEPYWRAQTRYENPTINVSDDGFQWIEPAGLTNPIDGIPGGGGSNSDADMILVGSTLYCYYREYGGLSVGQFYEKIQMRSSTNGITWSSETTVLDNSSTIGTNTTRSKMISPTIINDGTTWYMWYTNDGVLTRRTSTDGVTWGAASACTISTAINGSHVDAMRSTDGRIHILLQDIGAASTDEINGSSRKLWLVKSSDNGLTFTVGALPILNSEGMAQRMIYRCSGEWFQVNGKDYYKIWASCVSYSLANTAADAVLEAATSGSVESYYVGYTEGYDPNDLPTATGTKTALYPTGDIISPASIRGRDVGGDRLFGRVLISARGMFDRLRAMTIRTQHLVVEGPNLSLSAGNALTELAGTFGYQTQGLPAAIVSSHTDTTGGLDANVAFHYRGADATKTPRDGWQIGINHQGALYFNQRTDAGASSDATTTLVGYFDGATGQLILTKGVNVTAGTITLGTLPFVSGNRIRIVTALTPTSSADATGGTGDIARDDNYIYVKTSTGWKRSALTTW